MGPIRGLMLLGIFYLSVACSVVAAYHGVFLRYEKMWCYGIGAVAWVLLIDRIVRNDPRNNGRMS